MPEPWKPACELNMVPNGQERVLRRLFHAPVQLRHAGSSHPCRVCPLSQTKAQLTHVEGVTGAALQSCDALLEGLLHLQTASGPLKSRLNTLFPRPPKTFWIFSLTWATYISDIYTAS